MSDGRVEYEVRADTSKLDNDLSQAKQKIVKSADETATKQEKATEKSVEAVKNGEKEKISVVEKSNTKVENSTNDAEKKRTNIVSKAADKIKSSIKQSAQQSAQEISKQSSNAEQSIDGANNKIIASVGKAVAAIGGISAAYGLVKSSIDSVVSLDKGGNQIAAALGLSEADAEKYKGIIKDVYADNYGESFEDISKTISLIKQQMKGIGDDEIKGATEAAYMLADVYDIDVSESIRGANSLVNQFGITAEEAYNLMAQGAEKGLNQNGDLADQIAEYATYYSQLGFSAEDAFNMMLTAADNGVYQIDKINDAMKEFGIRSIDGSQTTADGFHALGLDAEKLGKAFSDGGDTAKEAFNIVINALADMDDSVAQDAAGVALFGTQWEDLGADAVLSLKSVNGEIDTTRDKLSEINEVKYDDLGSMLETLKRKFELMLQPLGEQLIPIIIEAVEQLTPVVESLIPALIELLPSITGIIKDILPILVNVVKFIIEFKDVLGPLAIGLGVGTKAAKLFTSALNHPVLVAATAIATLAVGIGKIINQAVSCSDEVQALVDNVNALSTSCDSAITSGEAECEMLQNKADRYEELRTKVERTADEEAELKGLAEDLQTTLGNNCVVINRLTGEYYSAADAVDDYCTQKMKEITLSAYEEKAKKSIAAMSDINDAIKKKEDEINQQTTGWGAFQTVASNVLNKTTLGLFGEDSSAKYSQMGNDLKALYDQKAQLQSNIDEWEKLTRDSYITQNTSNGSSHGPDLVFMNDEEQAQFYGRTLNSAGDKTKVDYTYIAPSTSNSKTTSSNTDKAGTAQTSTPAANSNTHSGGNTINITSFIPTVWDDVATANAKLAAGGIASSLVGNSKSGKLIDGLSSTKSAAISTAEEVKDATLNDVVTAIKALKTSQEKMQYTLDVTLKTDNYTLAKATVKGINAITKSTGKSPLTS